MGSKNGKIAKKTEVEVDFWNMFFEERAQKVWNLQDFSPQNRKYKAFIAFLSDNIFNFEAK